MADGGKETLGKVYYEDSQRIDGRPRRSALGELETGLNYGNIARLGGLALLSVVSLMVAWEFGLAPYLRGSVGLMFDNSAICDRVLDVLVATAAVTAVILIYDNQITRQITLRRVAETAVRDQAVRFRHIFETPYIAIMIRRRHDWQDGRLTNGAALRMLGYRADEFANIRFRHLVHPDDRARADTLRERLFNGEIDHGSIELRVVRKDGKVIHVSLDHNLLRDADGNPNEIISTFREIPNPEQGVTLRSA